MTQTRWSRPVAGLLALAAAGVACLAISASASASVQGGYNEPAYTKTNGNNAFWWQWQATTGYDSNINDVYTYYLCFNTTQNGLTAETSDGTRGPGSTNCTGSLRPANNPNPSSGNYGAMPFSTSTVLQDGAHYSMCAKGWRLTYSVWSSAGISYCPGTRIDRNKPSVGVELASGATITKNPVVPVSIGYNDATSPPWNGSNGYASNWVCIQQGANCTPSGQPNNNCSVPNNGFGQRINSFTCGMSIGGGDGRYHFCTFAGDSAVPDNPSGTNQFVNATSNNANLSTTACDSIVLDRTGPGVSVTASSTNVKVGDLVTFSASASDPNGVSGQPSWTFGDNTAPASGATATHTYTQPGTYVVKATQNDTAGNTGEGTQTITVSPASTPGGDPTDPTDPTDPKDPSDPGDPGTNPGGDTGGGTTPGTTNGTSGGTPIPGGTTPGQITNQVGQQAGGGGTATVAVGALDVIAPKRFTAGKRTMLLAFTAESAGKAKVAFLRGSKVVARKGSVFGGPGTYTVKVKVPKKLKPGSYKLKVTFTPAGSSKAATKTIKVKVVGKKKKAKKSRGKTIVPSKLDGTRIDRAKKPRSIDPRKADRIIEVG